MVGLICFISVILDFFLRIVTFICACDPGQGLFIIIGMGESLIINYTCQNLMGLLVRKPMVTQISEIKVATEDQEHIMSKSSTKTGGKKNRFSQPVLNHSDMKCLIWLLIKASSSKFICMHSLIRSRSITVNSHNKRFSHAFKVKLSNSISVPAIPFPISKHS